MSEHRESREKGISGDVRKGREVCRAAQLWGRERVNRRRFQHTFEREKCMNTKRVLPQLSR